MANLGVDPERERDGSGQRERGEERQRLQRERVRERRHAVAVARDLPRQVPVLAEPAEDGDERRDPETEREDAEALSPSSRTIDEGTIDAGLEPRSPSARRQCRRGSAGAYVGAARR